MTPRARDPGIVRAMRATTLRLPLLALLTLVGACGISTQNRPVVVGSFLSNPHPERSQNNIL